MKILQINKFNYLRGGAERCFLELSKILAEHGNEVITFSMQHEKNLHNQYEKYFTNEVNLNTFSLKNIFKIFYNREAAKKLEALIKKEKPDIAHLHNIYHQISTSIIKVLKKYQIPTVMTLHDYKIICPNYQLFSKNEICYKCQGGKYYNCLVRKCSKNSYAKSFLAMLEAYFNKKNYDQIDLFIAPSQFMKDICVKFGIPESKIEVIYNFIKTKNPAI